MLPLGSIFLFHVNMALQMMIIASHFYWMENVFIFSFLPVYAEAKHTWLPRSGPYGAGLSFLTSQARWKVHSLFLGCERHQGKSVFDRSQRNLFNSDLGQRIRSGSGPISKGKLLLARPLTILLLHWAATVSRPQCPASLWAGGWGEGESLSPPKSPGLPQ